MLLFDEVISGFRVGPGGAAAHYGVQPDMVAFGKILGGGLPCAAFGGPEKVMSHLAPLGKAYHAGTLSDPLAMAAGLAQISELADGQAHERLEALGQRLQHGVEKVLCDEDLPVRMVRVGSLFWFSFDKGEPPRRADQIRRAAPSPTRSSSTRASDAACTSRPPYEVGFLSTAHTEADIDRAIDVFTTSLRERSRERPTFRTLAGERRNRRALPRGSAR